MGRVESLEEKRTVEVCPITGLPFRRDFLNRVGEQLDEVAQDSYCMIAIDLEHFRLFNKIYGRDEGDILLGNIGSLLETLAQERNGQAGYVGGDNFGLFIPYDMKVISKLKRDIIKNINKWSMTGYLPAIGVYCVDDTSVLPATMYDRASMVLPKAIGNYAKRIHVYDPSVEQKVEEELKMLAEIQQGLEKEEFTFFAQPQCDIATGKIVGAESLVRWQHGTKGLIPPGVFIPVLEKNGFIANLDRYVWRKVCEWLRSWIDRGYHPVPISINVSRIDIYSMDVPTYLLELTRTYNLPTKLLKVEITESAYAESNERIVEAVMRLRNDGFLVMMDDFGSGYSSLNMLKSVAVDVIKLDMRFLDINEAEEQKGIDILESVVSMARNMGLPIIVEGVETQKQEKFLMGLGCRYTQGFYYYRPLPINQFEELLSDERNLDFDGIWCRQVEDIHVRELMDTNQFSDVLLNNILGAVAFYDLYENSIQITRVNEKYFMLAGINPTEEGVENRKVWSHVRDDDRMLLFSIFEKAYENPINGADGYIHFMREDGKVLWVYMRAFFLREQNGHKIYYSSLIDMTGKSKKTKVLTGVDAKPMLDLPEKQKDIMEYYYSDMPFGYCLVKVLADENENATDYEIVYANRELEMISGEGENRIRKMISQIFSESRNAMLDKAYCVAYLGERINQKVYNPVSGHYLQLSLYQFQTGYLACMVRDVTHREIYEGALNSIMHSYREVYYVHLEDNYCRMLYPDEEHLLERGNYEEIINRHYGTGKIVKYDVDNVRRFLSLENLREVLRYQDGAEYSYKRTRKDGSAEWCLSSFTVSERDQYGMPRAAILMIRSIDDIIKQNQDKKRQRVAESLASMSDGFFVYSAGEEQEILYANPKVVQIFGCDTTEEFMELVHGSFKGMVHPDDYNRIEWEIQDQIEHSEKKMDYIQYRITRKDGEIRWLDDYGHLEPACIGGEEGVFYVFISDITDKISQIQQDKLIQQNKHYN